MTGNEKRDALICEVRDLSSRRAELEASTLSTDAKRTLDRNYRTQVEKLIAVLMSPALATICE